MAATGQLFCERFGAHVTTVEEKVFGDICERNTTFSFYVARVHSSEYFSEITNILFPKIKEIFKGRHFVDIDDIWSNTTAALKAIPQNQFQNCFEG